MKWLRLCPGWWSSKGGSWGLSPAECFWNPSCYCPGLKYIQCPSWAPAICRALFWVLREMETGHSPWEMGQIIRHVKSSAVVVSRAFYHGARQWHRSWGLRNDQKLVRQRECSMKALSPKPQPEQSPIWQPNSVPLLFRAPAIHLLRIFTRLGKYFLKNHFF